MRAGTRILLVEDDRSIAGFVEPELEHLGFLVRCAYDGVAALEELLARIRALLRRVEGDEILRVADLEINTSTREVRREQREIELTTREYELLEFMAQNPRRVLSRDLLLSRVWDEEFGLTTNVVDVYVGYLRKKVDAPGEEKLIRTVRGAGYALKGA